MLFITFRTFDTIQNFTDAESRQGGTQFLPHGQKMLSSLCHDPQNVRIISVCASHREALFAIAEINPYCVTV